MYLIIVGYGACRHTAGRYKYRPLHLHLILVYTFIYKTIQRAKMGQDFEKNSKKIKAAQKDGFCFTIIVFYPVFQGYLQGAAYG